MKDLPRNWTRTRLGDACSILDFKRIPVNSKERQVRTGGKPESELFPYYGATGQVDVIDGYLFEGEHVLLGEDGAPFLDPFRAKAYVVNGRFWVNNHAHILKAHGSNRYLSHYLNTVHYEDHVTGTTRPKLTKGALVSIPIALPPLNEQHRIVERIETLFDEIGRGVESLRDAKRAIGFYRQSLLKSAFEGHLTAAWRAKNADQLESRDVLLTRLREERERHYRAALEDWKQGADRWKKRKGTGRKPPRPKRPLDFAVALADDYGGVPSQWRWLPLSSFGEVAGGLTKNRRRDALPLKARYLRVANVYSNRLKLDEIREIGVTEEELERTRLVAGDLLFVEGNGSVEQIGRVAIWNGSVPGMTHQNHLIRFRANGLLSPRFALYFMMSPVGRERITNQASSTSGLHTLSISKVEGLPVPLCCPAEQAQIVRILDERLEAVDNLQAEIDLNLARAETLRQSILKTALAGELAPQDSTDEPASALLARIRVERDAVPSKRSRRRTNA